MDSAGWEYDFFFLSKVKKRWVRGVSVSVKVLRSERSTKGHEVWRFTCDVMGSDSVVTLMGQVAG